MIRRIKPVSRVRRTEAEVRRTEGPAPLQRRLVPTLAELAVPAVDIYEKEREIVVEMEVPGVQEKDIRILLYPSRLEVRGLKREASGHGSVRYLRLEREFGPFRREIVLPGAVVPDGAYASLENGVLTIVLGKPPRRTLDVDIKSRPSGE
ncbi:MAG TPA: Hsp20/alpha crystallin family protein [Terriglobales bacterium]|nr:Hsp20/alpha crystallin family protein [Terriglobales bacterium]